jgi:general transcription factor 3C polypeptide 3 (transcription factor C subunit 4)
LSSVMWKAENIVLTQKFLVRLGSKFPDSIPLQVMIGHSSALRGTHKLALASYLQVYKHIKETIKKPNEIITVNDKEVWEYPPYFAKLLEMLCLCIGVAYIHLSINRRAADRQLLVLQGYTFMHEYYRLSGESEEASFNMGRAYHQLGLYQYAIFYYEKILRSSGDFVQEAAYNLAHIYKKSGNTALARQIIQENIVI